MRLFIQRIALLAVLVLSGCMLLRTGWGGSMRPPAHVPGRDYAMEITGYCPCGECCNWHRNWLFTPVVASGPHKGDRKKVGMTASGTKARPGTIAADTSIFPFGTIMYIPGYGYGRVEDRGGDIKGYHLDLFFRDHDDALHWGRVRKYVKVWLPGR